jgi:hypothetical protein
MGVLNVKFTLQSFPFYPTSTRLPFPASRRGFGRLASCGEQ